ncbi:MAG: ribosome-binding factor A [Candidatus Paceibacterota bacterium]|jgi:ribosome-binding factor A
MNFRKERLQGLVAKLLSEEIIRNIEISDALITIINVDIDSELDAARIYVEVFPDSKHKEAIEILKKKAPSLRSFLSKKINIRKFPMLVFK